VVTSEEISSTSAACPGAPFFAANPRLRMAVTPMYPSHDLRVLGVVNSNSIRVVTSEEISSTSAACPGAPFVAAKHKTTHRGHPRARVRGSGFGVSPLLYLSIV